MVRPSLDSSTTYAAVDLDDALESALKKQESELREMEVRKRELQELSKEQRFRPSDEVTTFTILKSVKDVIGSVIPLVNSMQEEWLLVVLGTATILATLFGINDAASEFIKSGGKVRVIVNISYPYIEAVRELSDIGEEVRHVAQLGILFVVFDRKIAVSAINAEVTRFSLSQPIAALWTDDPIYAQYLTSTFEGLWNQGIDAEERIQQLLEQGPPKA